MPEFNMRPAFSPCPCYKDVKAALAWLTDAFGFEPHMIIADADDNIMHAELSYAGGIVMIGSEWTGDHKSPANLGGKNTSSVHVHLDEDIDAHYARARAAGAQIDQAPETQFYGDRTYRCRDPEGHIWTFGQTVTAMSSEEWDAAMPGVKTRTAL
jgi:uncharacterized glyoxalase superfamily protein PhnB